MSSAIDISEESSATQIAAVPRIAFRPHRSLPWLVLPQGIPLQVLIDATAAQVPNTQSWFNGVVSQRGNLIPVFDLGDWAGYSAEGSSNEQIVAIGLGAHSCALRCSESPRLLHIAAESTEATAMEGAIAPYLSRPYASTLGNAYEFDIYGWLASAAAQVPAVGQ